ncbi:unnamed protein product [Orchesella dallaii]|uniref:Death domain-containing protein n=1 Tax=Orchesella dallaii TaxID=48710 RepID=A0ABP1PPZ8_9HEXA
MRLMGYHPNNLSTQKTSLWEKNVSSNDLIIIFETMEIDPPTSSYTACTFVRVRDVLSNGGSAGQLWIKLIDVSRSLEIPSDRVVSLQMRISTNTITHSDALYEILESWKAKFSGQAKLPILFHALKNNLLNDSADALRDHFKAAPDEIVKELSDLKISGGEKLLLTSKWLKFQGKDMKVEELRIRKEQIAG